MGPGCHSDVSSPCSRWSAWRIPAGLGHQGLGSLDGSTTSKRQQEENKKSIEQRLSRQAGRQNGLNTKTAYGRNSLEIKGGVLPCLCPFPLLSASSIPVDREQGLWSPWVCCLSFHLTYFPFGRLQKMEAHLGGSESGISLQLGCLVFNRCTQSQSPTPSSPPIECPQLAARLSYRAYLLPRIQASQACLHESPPLLASHGPGVRRQMQIAEPSRPNGLHLKIVALTMIGHAAPLRPLCLAELQHSRHKQDPEHRKGGQTRRSVLASGMRCI